MSERARQYNEKGYVILRGLLTQSEVERLKKAMEEDMTLHGNEYGRSDARGLKTRVSVWNKLPNNIAGNIARAEKVVGAVEEILGEEIYHYHSKLIMKDPHTGGAFLWHQDYGYWYEYKCLYPTMGTLWMAVDKADRTNGCLQIIEGSHHVGRVESQRKGDQLLADQERVEVLKKRLPLRYIELEPGDAVFFHGNLLHTSDQNVSGKRRWAFLVAYNTCSNIPYGDNPHGGYEPIEKVPDSAIMTSPLTMQDDNVEFWTFQREAQVAIDNKVAA